MTAGTGPPLGERGRARSGVAAAARPSSLAPDASPGPPSGAAPGAPSSAPSNAGPAPLRTAPGARRHCWVLPDPDEGVEPFAGLVAEWRQTAAGWQARVVYALGDAETATVVESWLSAEQLRPA